MKIRDKTQTFYKAWIIIFVSWSFYLYEYILRVSPSVMTHELMSNFGITTTSLGVLVSLYYFAYVLLQIPGGVLIDRFGPRVIITVTAFLCFLGSLLFAQSNSLIVAKLGRFLIGIGSSCAYLCFAKLASEWFSSSKFPLIAGIGIMAGSLGGTLGGRPFAWLVNSFGWRESMWWASVVGGVIMILSWSIVRDHPSGKMKKNIQSKKLTEGLKIIISNPQNILIGFYGCMMCLPLSAFAELWGVPFLMGEYNINNELASDASALMFIGMGIGSILSSFVSNYLKSRVKVLSWSSIGTFLSFLAIFYIPNISFLGMKYLIFCTGIIAGGQVLYFTVGKENNPHELSATSIGFTNFFVMSSGVIFQPLLGWVIDFVWDGSMKLDGTPLYSSQSYRVAFSTVCIALLMSWIVSMFIKETYPTDGL